MAKKRAQPDRTKPASLPEPRQSERLDAFQILYRQASLLQQMSDQFVFALGSQGVQSSKVLGPFSQISAQCQILSEQVLDLLDLENHLQKD